MLSNNAETRQQGLAVHAWSCTGPVSVSARDRTLLECYDAAAVSRAKPLVLRQFLAGLPVTVHDMRDRDLREDGILQRQSMRQRAQSFYV